MKIVFPGLDTVVFDNYYNRNNVYIFNLFLFKLVKIKNICFMFSYN